MRKTISVVLLLCLFVLILQGCDFKSDEQMIRDRVSTFLRAYNSGDIEAAIDCMAAKTRSAYRSALNIGNALIGLTGFDIGVGDLFGLSTAMLSEGETLHLDVLDITITSDTTATVKADMRYQCYDEYTEEIVYLAFVKEYDDWYIKDQKG